MEKQSNPNNYKEMQAQVDTYVKTQSQLDLLRFITCGSVDDGKSTLIGRMLYEAQMIFEDQVTSGIGPPSATHELVLFLCPLLRASGTEGAERIACRLSPTDYICSLRLWFL